MTRRPLRAFPALAAIGVAAALLLTGCGGAAKPGATARAGSTEPTVIAGEASAAPSPSPSASAVAADCDALVVSDLREQFDAQGWTFKETPFTAGGVTPDEGLLCTWADYDVPSGNLMIFGWAPITADQSADMQQGLEAEGWLREEDGTDVYITEDPEQAPTVDADGYGMTYQFGDGWVVASDTKQNLLLLQRPQD